ncbi:hypothetical protein Tco_1337723 [Tanacetum coccineum]
MVTDLEDSKTHTVGGIWSGKYMDHGFTKSMSELDSCYTMLQELRSVIVGGALIHKNYEGSKHEGRIISPTISDFGGNCACNQSSFNNGRIEEWEEKKKEDRVSTTKIFCSKILINNSVCSLIIDGCSINNLVSRKLVDFLKLPMDICPIEGYQVYRVPVTIGKSYKIEVLCIVDDIDECHILLGRPWQSTNKVGTLKTCKEIMDFNDDEDVKGFRVDVKHKSIEDKVRREKVFEVEEALNIENSRASSFQVRGIIVDETKVNAVRYWSSLKTLPEVRNNKVADAFKEEYELYCKKLASKALVKDFKLPTEPRHSPYQIRRIKKGLALKVTKICKVHLAIGKHYNELVICDVIDIEVCHVLLGRPWKHDMDATHQGKSNMYLFRWSIKTIAVLSLSVISPKMRLENKTLATLVASPKEFQAKRKETGVLML